MLKEDGEFMGFFSTFNDRLFTAAWSVVDIMSCWSLRNNNWSNDRFINWESDIDSLCIIWQNNELSYEKIREYVSMRALELFFDWEVNVLNIRMQYWYGRNSINTKVIRKAVIEEITNSDTVKFTSFRPEALRSNWRTEFYTDNLGIPKVEFSYDQVATDMGFLINYYLRYITDEDMYIMSDIISMILFSTFIKKTPCGETELLVLEIRKKLIDRISGISDERISNLLAYHWSSWVEIDWNELFLK